MAFNRRMMTITPQDDTARERYWQFMAGIGQSHRTDLTRQFDRLDLDEGRDVPAGRSPVTPGPPPAPIIEHHGTPSPLPLKGDLCKSPSVLESAAAFAPSPCGRGLG